MTPTAAISAIEIALPEGTLENETLAAEFKDWTAEKIRAKTGITRRHIAAPDECASDLAVKAAQAVLRSGPCQPADIDYVLCCTQSPDYLLPTTACLIQERLALPTTCGALDINLGCSGYIYGLGLAKALIESGQSKVLLFITADTYSKFISPTDKSVRTLFGDGASATLISSGGSGRLTGPFIYGTDGAGARNLIVPAGGSRKAYNPNARLIASSDGGTRTENHLYMNGPEIFAFTLKVVPDVVSRLLDKAGLAMSDIDLFVFHQANQFMLEHLRKKLAIPPERFVIALAESGNTVSSTIPIALKQAAAAGQLKENARVMLVGFGVGYSWGATLVHWEGSAPRVEPDASVAAARLAS